MLRSHQVLLKRWLWGFLVLLLCTLIIGGATRLTRSGLSITEWHPIAGVVPPYSDSQWTQEFQKYQQFPEYQNINFNMSLDEFKTIYWMEYWHRIFARLVGLYALVSVYLLWRHRVSPLYLKTSIGLVIGVIVQGIVGWLMVKSGLEYTPHVSPLMLSLHFLNIMGLFSVVTITLAQIERTRSRSLSTQHHGWSVLNVGLLLITLWFGALTSGSKAGFIYNTFPLMGGAIIPSELFDLTPFWNNFLNNLATIQWTHRLLALLTLVSTCWGIAIGRCSWLYGGAVLTQICIGILMLIHMIPFGLGLAHQLMGVIVFMRAVYECMLYRDRADVFSGTSIYSHKVLS